MKNYFIIYDINHCFKTTAENKEEAAIIYYKYQGEGLLTSEELLLIGKNKGFRRMIDLLNCEVTDEIEEFYEVDSDLNNLFCKDLCVRKG